MKIMKCEEHPRVPWPHTLDDGVECSGPGTPYPPQPGMAGYDLETIGEILEEIDFLISLYRRDGDEYLDSLMAYACYYLDGHKIGKAAIIIRRARKHCAELNLQGVGNA